MAKYYVLRFSEKKELIGRDAKGEEHFRKVVDDEKEALKLCVKKVWSTETDMEKQRILFDHLDEIDNCDMSLNIDTLMLDNIRAGLNLIAKTQNQAGGGKPLNWAELPIIRQVITPEEKKVEEEKSNDPEKTDESPEANPTGDDKQTPEPEKTDENEE